MKKRRIWHGGDRRRFSTVSRKFISKIQLVCNTFKPHNIPEKMIAIETGNAVVDGTYRADTPISPSATSCCWRGARTATAWTARHNRTWHRVPDEADNARKKFIVKLKIFKE